MKTPTPRPGGVPAAARTWTPGAARAVGLLALAAGLAAAVGPAPARAGMVVPKFAADEKPGTFITGTLIHGNISKNDTHKDTASAKDAKKKEQGKLTYEFKEVDGGGKNADTLTIVDGSVQHVGNANAVPLPGKGKTITAGKGELKDPGFSFSGVVSLDRELTAHGKEFDIAYGQFIAFVDPNLKDINGYMFHYTGSHTDKVALDRQQALDTVLVSNDPASTRGGGALVVLDTLTGGFGLALSVLGLDPAGIKSAVVRRGTPSVPGVEIYDLDEDAFEDLDTLGAGRNIAGGLFSASDLPDVLSGNAFIEIVTDTEVFTGQLKLSPMAAVPEPSVAVLFGVGGLLAARQVRRGRPAGPAAAESPA